MTAFPTKIKFTQTEIIAELKTIESKDTKGVKITPMGVYEYLDNGKTRKGKVTSETYKNDKIGSTVKFSLETLLKLEKENILKVLI